MRSDSGRNPQANRRAAARRESPTRSDEHRQTLREANELMLKSALRSKRNAERCFGGRFETPPPPERGRRPDPPPLRLRTMKDANNRDQLNGRQRPAGGAMLSILRFASGIPGGMEILLGKGFRMTFFDEES